MQTTELPPYHKTKAPPTPVLLSGYVSQSRARTNIAAVLRVPESNLRLRPLKGRPGYVGVFRGDKCLGMADCWSALVNNVYSQAYYQDLLAWGRSVLVGISVQYQPGEDGQGQLVKDVLSDPDTHPIFQVLLAQEATTQASRTLSL